jgi:hypothetical protein
MAAYTVKFYGHGARPLRTEILEASNATAAARAAGDRLKASRFMRASGHGDGDAIIDIRDDGLA